MQTTNMIQTANISEKAEDKAFWKGTKGQGQIMGYIGEGWTVSVTGATMTRTKSVTIPSI